MNELNYHEELAKYYPSLLRKQFITLVLTHSKGAVILRAKPCHNGTFINLDFTQNDKFIGFRTVSLLELEPIYRQQQKEIDND